MKASVMFARFPFGRHDEPDVTDWLLETTLKAKADPRVGELHQWRIDDTPITMGRNKCLKEARKKGIDYLLMIDNDMSPDLQVPGAKPFWDTTFDFMLQHQEPCCVAAPYCGPPPIENVYIFRWTTCRTNDAQPDWQLSQYSREEAAQMAGICEVGALPTGLMLIDMRILDHLKPPWFYYEWTDATESEKASTEDVTFTRDLSLLGIQQYCNWDAWAGHWKRLCVQKPQIVHVNQIRQKFVDAVHLGAREEWRMTEVSKRNWKVPPRPVRANGAES